MSITLEKYDKSDRKQLKRLYLSAFPFEERCPYFIMMNREKKGKSEMIVARDNGEFIGFVNRNSIFRLYRTLIRDQY